MPELTARQAEAKRLWDEGKSYESIRLSMGINQRWLKRLLRAAGVQRRSGRPKLRGENYHRPRMIGFNAAHAA